MPDTASFTLIVLVYLGYAACAAAIKQDRLMIMRWNSVKNIDASAMRDELSLVINKALTRWRLPCSTYVGF